ncbi:hypothetical protein ACFQDE_03125 [Deinococcus caeni]|uniref:Uncharacterized protein n=1 Tax=Deinococcus caeni TaxID=569127 RepID=A0ABP9UDH5_9DEIO
MRQLPRLTLTLTAVLCAALGNASAQKTTLTVGVFPDLDSVVKAALPGFNKLYPNITVKINSLAYAQAFILTRGQESGVEEQATDQWSGGAPAP